MTLEIIHTKRAYVVKHENSVEQLCAELAQARAELDREHQVAKATMVELKRADWSAHVEAEGLRRQLKHAEGERDYWLQKHDELELEYGSEDATGAAIVEAAEVLLGTPLTFIGNPTESAIDFVAAGKKLKEALEHRSDAAAKLLERLATLDAAEAALANCGLTGIYDEFDGIADAIQQMVRRLVQLEGGSGLRAAEEQLADARRVARLWFRRAHKAELAAHIHDKACGELAQTVRTERAERLEAEQLAEHAKAELGQVRDWLTIQKQGRDGDRAKLLGRTAMLDTVETALQAERQLYREAEQGRRNALTLAQNRTIRLEQAEHRARSVEQRAERAEALAQLVTPELARMMDRLNEVAFALYPATARAARKLAAQIREALALEVNNAQKT